MTDVPSSPTCVRLVSLDVLRLQTRNLNKCTCSCFRSPWGCSGFHGLDRQQMHVESLARWTRCCNERWHEKHKLISWSRAWHRRIRSVSYNRALQGYDTFWENTLLNTPWSCQVQQQMFSYPGATNAAAAYLAARGGAVPGFPGVGVAVPKKTQKKAPKAPPLHVVSGPGRIFMAWMAVES